MLLKRARDSVLGKGGSRGTWDGGGNAGAGTLATDEVGSKGLKLEETLIATIFRCVVSSSS